MDTRTASLHYAMVSTGADLLLNLITLYKLQQFCNHQQLK